MAQGKKTGGRNFAKGNPGGPGRPSFGITQARNLNKEECEDLLNKLIRLPQEKLREIMSDNETQGLDALIASIIIKGIEFGDYSRLNFLFDRLIGKVKEPVEVSGSVTLESLIAKSFQAKKELE